MEVLKQIFDACALRWHARMEILLAAWFHLVVSPGNCFTTLLNSFVSLQIDFSVNLHTGCAEH